MEGGGKVAYSYGGDLHHDTKLLRSFSSVEHRKFGIGLFAGLLIVTCAYFSTAKFDAVHIAMSKQPSKPQERKNLFSRALSVAICICLLLTWLFFQTFLISVFAHAVSSAAKNAVGFSSPVNAGDNSKQPLGEAPSSL